MKHGYAPTDPYDIWRNDSLVDQIKSLYDLEIDPLEENNIVEEFPEIIKKMEKKLEEMISEKSGDEKPISKDELKKIEDELKKMGYI